MTNDAEAAKQGSTGSKNRSGRKAPSAAARYILITQCLQNDFFMNRSCRLCLPPDEVRRLLVGVRKHDCLRRVGDWHDIPGREIDRGPLAEFFKHSIERARKSKNRDRKLYVINIRDWHQPGPQYDMERRTYGSHCLRGSRGASYIQGLNKYLDPPRRELDGQDPRRDPADRSLVCDPAKYFSENRLRIHHVHSDSVFDFVPPEQTRRAGQALSSELTNLMDLLVYGTDDQLVELDDVLRNGHGEQERALRDFANQMRCGNVELRSAPVYVAVVGVYTDIKIQLLLTSIQSRYKLDNVMVSDSLTASMTLDRHLAGLDFADKVLGADVAHTLDDLLRFLGFEPTAHDDTDLIGEESYGDYRTFFLDKQSILAHRNRRLDQYLALSHRRSIEAHRTVSFVNWVLLSFGSLSLALALAGPVIELLRVFGFKVPAGFDPQYSLVAGSLGLLQLVAVFFSGPLSRVYRNLTNLVMLRVVLENHSMKSALARFHLTALSALPQQLSTEAKLKKARRNVELLHSKMNILQEIERGTYEALRVLGFPEPKLKVPTARASGNGAPSEPATQVPANPPAQPDHPVQNGGTRAP